MHLHRCAVAHDHHYCCRHCHRHRYSGRYRLGLGSDSGRADGKRGASGPTGSRARSAGGARGHKSLQCFGTGEAVVRRWRELAAHPAHGVVRVGFSGACPRRPAGCGGGWGWGCGRGVRWRDSPARRRATDRRHHNYAFDGQQHAPHRPTLEERREGARVSRRAPVALTASITTSSAQIK